MRAAEDDDKDEEENDDYARKWMNEIKKKSKN